MKSKVQGVFEILKSLMDRPRLGRQSLRELPFIMRGFEFAERWSSQKADASGAAEEPANPLQSYFDAHTEGRGIWKWTHYFDIYHRHLSKFVGRDVHLLEIGVYSGGSLQMWRDYLGQKCHVYGVDLEKDCKAYENEWTRIFVGDQADRRFWQSVKREMPLLDVLIDDGGHDPEQQIATLEEMLPHLRPGGVYLCEDMHRVHNWFASYVHGLATNLHAYEGVATGRGRELASPSTPFQSEIHSIHEYPFVTVIEKRTHALSKLIAPTHGTEWQPFLGATG